VGCASQRAKQFALRVMRVIRSLPPGMEAGAQIAGFEVGGEAPGGGFQRLADDR